MPSFYWKKNPHDEAVAMSKKPAGATAFVAPSYYKVAKGKVFRWDGESFWIRSTKSVKEINDYDLSGSKRQYIKRG